MKRIFLLTALAAASVTIYSCKKQIDTTPAEKPVTCNDNIICYARDISKTEFGQAESGIYPILWSENDEIEVISADGVEHSTYTLASREESGAGEFSSETPVHGEGRSAIYPASAFAGYASDGTIRVSLEGLASQRATKGLGDTEVSNVSLYPLWSKENAAEAGTFSFHSICGCIALQLNDYMGMGLKISSVEIRSKTRSLTGTIRINPADGTISEDGPAGPGSVKVTADEAIKISGDKPDVSASTECFMIAIPSGHYPAGDLTFHIMDDQGRVYAKTLTSEFTLNPGIVKKAAKLQLTVYYGTSNCVIVEPGASAQIHAEPYYSFSPRFAYENNRIKAEDGGNYIINQASAEVLWELSEGAGAFAQESVLSSCEYSDDGYINVTAAGNKGNAVVALKDEAGEVLWSYHVWVTDTPEDLEYTNIKGGTFMDRNLGATSLEAVSKTSPVKLDMLGMYYQHGRKDPFACSLTQWDKVLSPSVDITDQNGNIAYTVRHPETRIKNAVSKNSWNKYGNNLSFWGATQVYEQTDQTVEKYDQEADMEKTVYDPCPEGYKVPEAKYLNFKANDAKKATTSNGQTYIKYDGTHTSYWPAAGYICHGTDEITTTSSSGRRGTVLCNWTATANNNYGIRFFVNGTSYTLATNTNQGRATAASVRCRRIENPQGTDTSFNSQLEEPQDEIL